MASPELAGVIALLRANPVLQGDDVLSMRSAMVAASAAAPLPANVAFDPVDIGGVRAEWALAAGADPRRTVVYYHGGGYCLGSIESHRGLVAGISRAAKARVLNVDYRLAPEHPYPAAIEDGVAAFRFAVANGATPENTALAGDSAGGGVTAATLLSLRDAGDPLPAAAALISPWLDLTLSSDSLATVAADDPMLRRSDLALLAEAYLAGADARAPTASPVFAELAGLPPLILQVGTRDSLVGEGVRFGERARAAGVDIQLDVWEGLFHVWHAFADILPEGRDALEAIGAFFDRRFAEPARRNI